MKKATSILLLVLLLHNILGYYLFMAVKQWEIKKELALSFKNLKDEELIVFKVPVPIYHQTDRDFEIVEGDFEHAGKYYDMVKQKLENDTLLVYCYNNNKKEKLFADLSEHTKIHVIDFTGKTDKNEKLFKSFIKEYIPVSSYTIAFSLLRVKQEVKFYVSQIFFSISPEIQSPPPRQA